MKKMKKNISVVLMALVLTLTMIPTVVQAAVAPKTYTMYCSAAGDPDTYASINVTGLSSKEKVVKSSVKVSNSKMLVLDAISHSSNLSRRETFDGQTPETYSRYSAELTFQVKKAGTCKVSYKIGTKSYSTTVKVLNYTNPISSMTISGISSNLAGKFKKSNMASAKLASNKSTARITVKAASGWKINNIILSDESYTSDRSVSTYVKPASALTLYTDALKKSERYHVNVNLVNTKTGGTQYISLDLN